jgi:hypothetical protein
MKIRLDEAGVTEINSSDLLSSWSYNHIIMLIFKSIIS